MKRLLTILLALLLAIPAAMAEEPTLVERAIALGAALDQLAEDEEYLAQHMIFGKDKERIQAFAKGDRTMPVRIAALDMEDVLAQLLPQHDELPEAMQRDVRQRMPMAFVNSLNSQQGSDMLILSMYIQISNIFPAPGVTGQGVWILYYEEASPVAVSWYAENDAVMMNATAFAEDSRSLDGMPLVLTEIPLNHPARQESAFALAEELQTLARCEEYLTFMTDQADIRDYCRSFAVKEGEAPLMCLQAEASASPTNAVFAEIARKGVVALSSVASLHTTVIFASDETDGMGLYLLLYETGTPVLVEWGVREGACWMQASFCPIDELAHCRTVEEVNAWAATLGSLIQPFEMIE